LDRSGYEVKLGEDEGEEVEKRTFLDNLPDKHFREACDYLGDGLGHLLAEGLLDYL
jgi:hypothetical protein